jgi:carbon-monoxide dehydrogenase large subunit
MMETTGREQLIDLIGRHLGIDPLDVRRRNVLRQPDFPYTTATGLDYLSLSPSETLEQAAAMIDYDAFRQEQQQARMSGRFLGIGLSLFVEPSGIAFGMHAAEEAWVRIEPSGAVLVAMGSTSHGHSLETTIPQIVAEELGVALEDVTLVQGDSSAAPYGFGTGGSRSAPIGGTLAKLAAVKVRKKVLALAAHMLEASEDDLIIRSGQISVAGMPSMALSLRDVAWTAYADNAALPADMEPGLSASVRRKPPPLTFSNACHACTVELDVSTGTVHILRYVVSEDCGRMINPNVVEGQIAGGVVQGIGGALLEHMIYDEGGNPLTTTFLDYMIPTATDIPIIEYGHIETPSEAPGGFRGLGEGGAIAAPAAVMNAVNDALSHFGARLLSQPATPAAILDALAESTVQRSRRYLQTGDSPSSRAALESHSWISSNSSAQAPGSDQAGRTNQTSESENRDGRHEHP